MLEIIDDKSQHCIPFLLDRVKTHQERYASNPDQAPPLFLGLNGVQGAGKTVLVSTLQNTLRNPPYSLPVITLSLDDIYLTHADQERLATTNPQNPLLQHRGQPSTHDLSLGLQVFKSLREGKPTKIPQYDKSAFSGQGDRVDEGKWEVVNKEGERRVGVVIFEGWCVGFRAWSDDTLRELWEGAVKRKQEGNYNGRLGHVRFEDVRAVNEALREYDALTDQFDALIHIDAQNIHYVYEWRQEQERTLRATKGTGMIEEQVNHFVDGYYPSYELFTETLRNGAFRKKGVPESESKGKQLRLVVDKNRRVQDVLLY